MSTGLKVFAALVIVFSLAASVQAEMIKIGTATYNQADYNLIWDDNNNGNSLVWLDYSAPAAYWGNQMAWAAGLDNDLVYNLDPGYSVLWSESAWRLPCAGNNPSYGCHAATQEMGHLYYDELCLTGGYSSGGVTAPDLSCGPFENLALAGYWTRTEDPIDYGFFVVDAAWAFFTEIYRDVPYYDMGYGFQDIDANGNGFFAVQHNALAVRCGEVEQSPAGSVIPEPATLFLFGMGGIGMAARVVRRRK